MVVVEPIPLLLIIIWFISTRAKIFATIFVLQSVRKFDLAMVLNAH